jgi:hypothetical protein
MGSMRTPHDERGLFSRLPDDPAYWERLSAKIVEDAVTTINSLRDVKREWWSALGQYSTVLALGASAAVVAAVLLLPAGNTAETRTPIADTYGLAPAHPLAAPLVSATAPPPIETLMLLRTAERDQ